MILQAFGISITTFVGQNFGARKFDRVKKGINRWMAIALAISAVLSVLMIFFAPQLLLLFNNDPAVIRIGRQIIIWIVPFWFTYVPIGLMSGSLRGMGNTLIPTIITAVGIIGLRSVWILLIPNLSLQSVFMVYPATWIVTSIVFLFYYYSGLYKKGIIQVSNAI